MVSIWTMAAATLTVIGVSLWIAWDAADGRHLAGVVMGMLLAVLMTAQTVVRSSDRVVALERLERRQRTAQRPDGGVPDRVRGSIWYEPDTVVFPRVLDGTDDRPPGGMPWV